MFSIHLHRCHDAHGLTAPAAVAVAVIPMPVAVEVAAGILAAHLTGGFALEAKRSTALIAEHIVSQRTVAITAPAEIIHMMEACTTDIATAIAVVILAVMIEAIANIADMVTICISVFAAMLIIHQGLRIAVGRRTGPHAAIVTAVVAIRIRISMHRTAAHIAGIIPVSVQVIPAMGIAALKFTAVVVFPTPPF